MRHDFGLPIGSLAVVGYVTAALTYPLDPDLAARLIGLPILCGVWWVGCSVLAGAQILRSSLRLRAGEGSRCDLVAWWSARTVRLRLRGRDEWGKEREVIEGVAEDHDVSVLHRWIRSGQSTSLLADCVRAGFTDAELTAHLDGTTLLDPTAVTALAALRGTPR